MRFWIALFSLAVFVAGASLGIALDRKSVAAKPKEEKRRDRDFRGGFFSHLLRLDAGYHDTSKIGDHMSLATNDTESVRMFLGIGLLRSFVC